MNFIDHYAMIIHMYSYARQCNIITERVSEALNIPCLEGTQDEKKKRQSITSTVRNPSLDDELAHLVLAKQRPNIFK